MPDDVRVYSSGDTVVVVLPLGVWLLTEWHLTEDAELGFRWTATFRSEDVQPS